MEQEEREVRSQENRTRTVQSRGAGSKTRSRRPAAGRNNLNYLLIGVGVLVVFVLILVIIGVRGCGADNKSPENVVKALVKAETEGKAKKAAGLYGAEGDAEGALKEQIDAEIAYYQAHNTKDMKVVDCGVLLNSGTQAYVYLTYNLVLDNDQEYPCVTTFMTRMEDDKHYVIPSSQITDDMRKRAAEAYEKFMTSEAYKTYEKTYDTFIKKNPGYEDKIIGKLA